MDPDAVLEKLRYALSRVDKETDSKLVDDAVDDIIDAARDLDEWLSKGGFLPQGWAR